MFCVQNRQVILWTRSGKILLFFLLLWIFIGASLYIHTHVLKNRIKEQQLAGITTALNSYLEQNTLSNKNPFNLHNTIPQSIDFIRITNDGQQLLITGTSHIAFQGLVDIAPSSQGAWVDLSQPKNSGEWLLVSKKLINGGVAQAGKNDRSAGLAIYKKIVRTSYWTFLFSAFPCLGLAFLFVYLMKAPLRSLETSISSALDQKTQFIQQNLPENHDLAAIYQLLTETFSQNQQLISEMQSSLDNVAHDLRTPMTRLRAVAEYTLQSEKDDPEMYRSALSDCLEESERVLSMLKIMMSVAEAEAGTMRLQQQEFDIIATLEDVIGLYQYVAEEEQISVILQTEKNTIPVFADKTRISQVWANLLDNAIKYGHKSGMITIKATSMKDQAIIQFCDDGLGISDNEINRIWERLYRGDRSRTKQGLGLGLNYVKAVVEAHDGTVVVTSRIKEGSCFEVRLPLVNSILSGQVKITN
jgi:signal transduction histidine kinase